MRLGKRCRLLLCFCALLLLSGCDRLKLESQPAAAVPALQLLTMPAYEDQEAAQEASAVSAGTLRVDLWLDASQVMGGVNPNEESMYPHFSRKYREGGFHYRYGNTAGWYEDVLENLLAAAGNAQVRVLRCGNERLRDDFLTAAGFPTDEESLRSVRRDMLTYAVDPAPDLFSGFSAESMEGSYYALGSPQLNQLARFRGENAALLENPGWTETMNAALEEQIAAFASQTPEAVARFSALGDDRDSPLHYALSNLDMTRLSVITCDPATLRRLEGTTADGAPVSYLRQLLEQRGVFDAGLNVELYALRLDYLGQMSSFCSADLSEPLVWGRLDYNSFTKKTQSALPMPRVLLMLAVGKPSQLRAYTATLNALLDGDADLGGLRGPEKGQLVYKAEGRTVAQQPFGFAYECVEVSRPGAGYYTQHTVGFAMASEGGDLRREGAIYTAALSPTQGTRSLTLRWPAARLAGGVELDVSRLVNVGAEVIDSLLLTDALPNTPENETIAGDGVQTVALRDKRYVFTRRQSPFAEAAQENPFSLTSVRFSDDGTMLEAVVEADASKLQAGYYRLRLTADASGGQFSWPSVPWAEEGSPLCAQVTAAQVVEWERFSAVLTRYARELKNVPRQFTHAWGDAETASYKGATIPDFPPVYRAPFLSGLLGQLRDAANVDTVPYIRCVFDVFVSELPAE